MTCCCFDTVPDDEGIVAAQEQLDVITERPAIAVPAQEPAQTVRFGVVAATHLAVPYDVVVVGGGPGGVAGALRAGMIGRRALLVDAPWDATFVDPETGSDPFLGAPTGLFSKALRDTAKRADFGGLRALGLDDQGIWSHIQSKCLELAQHNGKEVLASLSTFKVDYLASRAKLLPREGDGPLRLEAGGTTIVATNVLLATGSRALAPDGVPFDEVRVFDSDSIAKLGFLPQSCAIIGSGIVALEFAMIFATLGCRVSLIVRGRVRQSLGRIGLDSDIGECLLERVAEAGVEIREGTTVKSFGRSEEAGNNGRPLSLTLSDKTTLVTDIYLAAAGRVPSTAWLEGSGVTLGEWGNADVDADTLQTSVPGVFAAGDLLPPPSPALASTAVEQATRAVSCMFSESWRCEEGAARAAKPCGLWTIPEAGYYGVTLAAAKAKGIDAEEGQAKYADCLRGRVFAPHGMLKLVFEKDTGVIIGVHIVGDDAAELVHYGARLIDSHATLTHVIGSMFVAVTFHELFKSAAMDGNSRLAFGVQWAEILRLLSNSFGDVDLADAIENGTLRRKFEDIDVNGDGSLNVDEMTALLKELGARNISPGNVVNLVRLADEDNSGTIEYEEFEAIVRRMAVTSGAPIQKAP